MDRMDKYTSLANGLCIRVPGKNWECNYLDREPSSESCPAETLLSTTVYPGQMAYSVLYPDNRHYEGGYCHNQNNLPSQSPTLMSISINRENFTMDFWLPQSLPAYNSSVYRVVWVVDMLPPIPIIAPILQFNVSDCPLGFSIRSGSCACDGELQSHNYSCDINTKGFEGPPSYWTGLVGQSLLFDGHCHPNYCDSDRNDFHFTDDPAEACLGNRTGVLCGEWQENYSVVFGSDTCYDHCTDVYLLTIPAYALAGLLLVFLLFALRITVALVPSMDLYSIPMCWG